MPPGQHRLAVQGQKARMHFRRPHYTKQRQQEEQQGFVPGYWQPGMALQQFYQPAGTGNPDGTGPPHLADLMLHADPNQLLAAYVARMQSAEGSPTGAASNQHFHQQQHGQKHMMYHNSVSNGDGLQEPMQHILIDWAGVVSRQGSLALDGTLFNLLPQPNFNIPRPHGPAPDTPASLLSHASAASPMGYQSCSMDVQTLSTVKSRDLNANMPPGAGAGTSMSRQAAGMGPVTVASGT
eukprot:gene2301-2610_t